MRLLSSSSFFAVFLCSIAEVRARRTKDIPRGNSGASEVLGAPLGEADFQNSKLVDDLDTVFDENPIELAGLYEGDIKRGSSRNAIRDNQWPNAVIPYTISSAFSTYERSVIANAIKVYHEKTCIRFVGRSSESNYIHIMKGGGCYSHVGVYGPAQEVSLGNGCVYTGIALHEFMHAAGFYHEQSRADRDDHVNIHWENIQDGMEHNFEKYSLSHIDHLNASYDTCSIMHYDGYAFSKNGEPTITEIVEGKCTLGQVEGFSDVDIRKLNTLYQCNGYPQTDGTGTDGGGTDGSGDSGNDRSDGSGTDGSGDGGTDGSGDGGTDGSGDGGTDGSGDDGTDGSGDGGTDGSGDDGTDGSGDGGTDGSCEDFEESCSYWANLGYCTETYQEYMELNCKKSCDLCDGGTDDGVDGSGDDGTCEDNEASCPNWANFGFCTGTYQVYMEQNCKKSCDLCNGADDSGGGSTCQDNETSCPSWASAGYCVGTYQGYMELHCKKSCGLCDSNGDNNDNYYGYSY